MSTNPIIPKQIIQQLREQLGPDTRTWPEEMQDLIDPRVEAHDLGAPMSGKIAKFINTDYYYYWAGPDIGGANPNHERVESMRWAGWDYATTKDVQMCSETCVLGRNKDGFSNELRSGDRRLMKLPMKLRRQQRKSQNTMAIMMAYPMRTAPGFDRPMTLDTINQQLPGIPHQVLTESQIEEARTQARNQEAETKEFAEKLAQSRKS
jgi:hypothetical protein